MVCSKDLCRCNWFGRSEGFHHLGSRYSIFFRHVQWDDHPSLQCEWSKVRMEYPRTNSNHHTMKCGIAAVLSLIAIATLVDRRDHPVGG